MKKQLTEANLWRVLNDLRKTGGCLIYDGDGYRMQPSGAHVSTLVMTDLLGRHFIRAAADSPAGVYRITTDGRAAWVDAPVEIKGECDVCWQARVIHPVRLGEECLFVCGDCAARAGDAVRPEAAYVQ